MKFGGTSVADATCIKRVANRIVDARKAGHPVVAVVSARGDTTDELIELAKEISENPPAREMDMLLSTGERISAALVAMAIHELGYDAISLTGSQAGIVTDTVHTKAKILDIRPQRISRALEEDKIVLVAGFQGVSTNQDVTTLGRGGSDTTAVALAAALGAEACMIFTDVDGIYTTDPRIVPEARKLDFISNDEMLELTASGAKVMMLRSIEVARRFDVPLWVRSSFTDAPGTLIGQEEKGMEQAIVSGVTYALGDAKVTIHDLPDRVGVAAKVFTTLARANVNVDVIIQNVSAGGAADISFTADENDLPKITAVLDGLKGELGFSSFDLDKEVAKVTLVGAGMKTYPGIAAKMFETLAENNINIEMISTSSIKISCVIRKAQVETAVKALHAAFKLHEDMVSREEIFS
ncbi:MAG: aspartate kinase [Actinobacteria bacterium RBG_16_64_13]|nr:MAG: aspartate kinase [Actinobacteria bacterium RBG_16_64_13]